MEVDLVGKSELFKTENRKRRAVRRVSSHATLPSHGRAHADVLLTFVMDLMYFTARESGTLETFQEETEFSDNRENKRAQEEIVRNS